MSEQEEMRRRYRDFPDRDKWVNEAFFGLSQVAPLLEKIAGGGRVLEVGSGTGILLNIISRRYPQLRIEGIEPVGEGFQIVDAYHRALPPSLKLHKCGYEDFCAEDGRRYQLIFAVNVFEHLHDWRHFLRFAHARLADDGRCVLLFPNYTFPYEPHFSLPIFFGKALTHRLFRRAIEGYERAHGCAGYWNSLNFVTYMQVKKACARIGLAHEFDTKILREMLGRMATDAAYRERQKRLSVIAAVVKALYLDLPFNWGVLRNFTPYLKLELRRAEPA
ncbi:MAG: class I SAM-dependent methyltransferase [Gammaproteobacteria bacterium]|nr:class I SAM-dependent methyltransferase [Gammaproteobacteria bacterium]MDA8023106.1 class I SAM-dependent methyltransferase [Gammaproteobacteria bacterium]